MALHAFHRATARQRRDTWFGQVERVIEAQRIRIFQPIFVNAKCRMESLKIARQPAIDRARNKTGQRNLAARFNKNIRIAVTGRATRVVRPRHARRAAWRRPPPCAPGRDVPRGMSTTPSPPESLRDAARVRGGTSEKPYRSLS